MISLQLRRYLRMQKRDFIEAFKEPAYYPVGVICPEDSVRYIPDSSWHWDPYVPEGSAFIREIRGKKEYWIAVGEKKSSNYRRWFKKFIEREYQVPFDSVPRKLHADHVLSRTYAEEVGIRYVRMAFVWWKYNSNAGWSTEKGFIDYARRRLGIKKVYLIDYSIILKLLGIKPPKSMAQFKAEGLNIARKIARETNIGTPESILQDMTHFFERFWSVFPDQQRR